MFKLPDKKAENEELNAENVMNKEEEEPGTWLDTTPRLNLDHDLTSESSLFSPFSNGFNLYDDAFQTLNRHCSQSSPEKADDDVNDVGLSKVFSGMSIYDQQGNDFGGAKTGAFDITDSSYTHTLPLPASLEAHDPFFPEETGPLYQQRFCNEGTVASTSCADMEWGWDKGYTSGPPAESSLNLNRVRKLQKPSFATPSYPCFDFLPFGMDRDETWDVRSPSIFSQASSRLSQCLSPRRTGGDPVAFNCDDSFTIRRKDVEYCAHHGYRCNPLRGCRKNSHNEAAIHIPGCLENNTTLPSDVQQLLNLYSLAEDRGYIYQLAKDQNGCRFLQTMIDDSTSEDMRILFEGVIDNVVELMVHPFGNYLVQKLLHVCREDQRFHIVLMLTREPWQFVKTSLNTHGYVI